MNPSKLGENTAKRAPPNAGRGRPKGARNKVTTALREAILAAADNVGNQMRPGAGSVGYLEFLAQEQPAAFATLLGKVLPLQVSGDPAAPVVAVIERRVVKAGD